MEVVIRDYGCEKLCNNLKEKDIDINLSKQYICKSNSNLCIGYISLPSGHYKLDKNIILKCENRNKTLEEIK